jgi:hypothetical protein
MTPMHLVMNKRTDFSSPGGRQKPKVLTSGSVSGKKAWGSTPPGFLRAQSEQNDG